jgi:hypothetical protein
MIREYQVFSVNPLFGSLLLETCSLVSIKFEPGMQTCGIFAEADLQT